MRYGPLSPHGSAAARRISIGGIFVILNGDFCCTTRVPLVQALSALGRAHGVQMRVAEAAHTANEEQASFAFFLTDTSQLAEPERNFTLSPASIARINPNTKTAPVFRS